MHGSKWTVTKQKTSSPYDRSAQTSISPPIARARIEPNRTESKFDSIHAIWASNPNWNYPHWLRAYFRYEISCIYRSKKIIPNSDLYGSQVDTFAISSVFTCASRSVLVDLFHIAVLPHNIHTPHTSTPKHTIGPANARRALSLYQLQHKQTKQTTRIAGVSKPRSPQTIVSHTSYWTFLWFNSFRLCCAPTSDRVFTPDIKINK